MMVEFTSDELLTICEWAMDRADALKRCTYVNAYAYETAQSIFQKAHEEYFKREAR